MKRMIALVAVLTVAMVTPSMAALTVITSRAPIEGQSEAALRAALDEAVGNAVHDARQMGLEPVELLDASVRGDQIVVQVVATDGEQGNEPGPPGLSPGEHLAGTRTSL